MLSVKTTLEMPLRVKPTPLPTPQYGWFPEPTDLIVFVSHDNVTKPYRAVDGDSNRLYTNETSNKIVKCDQTTFEPIINNYMTVKLTDKCAWQMKIAEMNTLKVMGMFITKHFGWCDGDAEHVIPCVDQVVYKVMDCGGNRRKGIRLVKDRKGKQYVIVEMVQVVGEPPDFTYLGEPQYVQKQNCVTNSLNWKNSPQGDVNWLNMCDDRYAAYLLYDAVNDVVKVHFYPQVPFPAQLHGYSVTVLQYCLQGSTTLVRVEGELTGWYVADESPVPEGGLVEPYVSNAKRDYKCYIVAVGWPRLENGQPEPTVSNSGWTKS